MECGLEMEMYVLGPGGHVVRSNQGNLVAGQRVQRGKFHLWCQCHSYVSISVSLV